MAGDKTVSFKVISQSNDASTVYTLAIIGDETALAVKEVMVNGHKAKAPTLADPDYKYHAILPDATVVAVKAVSTKPNAKVSVDGGSVTVGSGSADVSMPISMSEKTVAIEMFKADTAAGAPADLEAKLQLKRLPRDYSALINVDGTAAKQQADGSYVAYVDAEAEFADIEASSVNNAYLAKIKGYQDGIGTPLEKDNSADTTVSAKLKSYLYKDPATDEIALTVKIMSDASDKNPAIYKLLLKRKSNNTGIEYVTANPGTADEYKQLKAENIEYKGKRYDAYKVIVPLAAVVPGNPTYTAGMEIQAKDSTTMISLRGSNYNDTQEGKLMKSLALADKELDLDGDGINETFVIPFSAKAQSGDVREYLILATLDDMTVFAKNISFNDEELVQAADGSYTGYVDKGASYAKLFVQASTKGMPEVRDLAGDVVLANPHNLSTVVTDKFDVSKLDPFTPVLEYRVIIKTKLGFEKAYPLYIKEKSKNVKIKVKVGKREAVWDSNLVMFVGSAAHSDTAATVIVETEDENAYVGIEEAAVHKHKAEKLISLPNNLTQVKIRVKAQDGTNAVVAGKDYYLLTIAKRSTEADIVKIVRTSDNQPAVKEKDQNDEPVYAFFVDKTDEEFEIAVTPSPKATVRVGYYNTDNK